MGRLAGFRVFVAVLAMETSIETTQVQKLMEKLDRGVVAIHEGEGRVFVGWRLLGTEQPDLGFNVYRTIGDAPTVKINSDPLTGPTHFQDFNVKLDAATRYSVRSNVDGAGKVIGQAGKDWRFALLGSDSHFWSQTWFAVYDCVLVG